MQNRASLVNLVDPITANTYDNNNNNHCSIFNPIKSSKTNHFKQVNRKLPTSWRACKQPTNTMNKRCRRLQPDPRKPVKSSNLFGWFQMEDNFKKVISCRQNEPICGPKMSGFIYKRTKRKCASNETLSIKISPIKIILCLALAELICDRTCLGSFSQSGIAPVRFATALSTPNSNNNNNSDERGKFN